MAEPRTLATAFVLAMQPGGVAREATLNLGIPLGYDLRPLADALAAVADEHAAPKVAVGDVLHGYCGGIFGDFYGEKTVEAIGAGWVVVREGGVALFGDVRPEALVEYLDPDNWGDR
jgi:hypothetical protein